MLRSIADTLLETTIVGSFTKLGSAARSELFDWGPAVRDMSSKQVLITGGSSGLGRETARRLVEAGATVYVTSRSLERAEKAAAEINYSFTSTESNTAAPAGEAIGAAVDTGELESVRALAARIVAATDSLDVVIHNAGALTEDRRTNSAGMELTLASHLVGPYALTVALRDHLSVGAKVLWMASGGMYTQGLDVDHLEMSEDSYRGAIAYARAKRGQVELVRWLGPKWAPDVVMQAMHPGWVDTDGVSQALPGFGKVMGPLLRDVESGSDTMVWLACGGADDEAPGQFWLDRRPRSTSYLPGTGTNDVERAKLVDWLDRAIAG